jgi:hypothetical protein
MQNECRCNVLQDVACRLTPVHAQLAPNAWQELLDSLAKVKRYETQPEKNRKAIDKLTAGIASTCSEGGKRKSISQTLRAPRGFLFAHRSCQSTSCEHLLVVRD